MGASDMKRGGGTSLLETWFTILCTMAGTGILQLPYTLKQGGWIGVIVIFFNGLTTYYTGIIILRCAYPPGEDGPALSYPRIGRRAFGRVGEIAVHLFQKATLLGISTLFLILAAGFLLEGLGGNGKGLIKQIGNDEDTWTRNWTMIGGVLVAIPLVGIRSLKEIPALTFLGLLASFQSVVAVVIVSAMLAYPSNSDVNGSLPNNITHTVVDWTQMPSAFTAITVSFGGHSCFPTIESHMARPKKFDFVLGMTYIGLLTMYLVTAIAGYWAFGSTTRSPILSNFPTEGALGTYGIVTKLLISMHVLTAYPILMHVFVEEIEPILGIDGPSSCEDEMREALIAHSDHRQRKKTWRTHYRDVTLRSLFRLALVIATTLVATYLPYFPPFMTLVGAVCLTMAVFVMPVVFYWRIHDTRWYNKLAGVVIVTIGLTTGGIATYQAIEAIAKAVKK